MSVKSIFHTYSLGIVATNKEPGDDFVEIVPIEKFPMVNGELTDNVEKYLAKAVDERGLAYQIEIDTTLSHKCKWLPLSQSNRLTSPDVRRGEPVLIFTFGDKKNDFYWDTRDNDPRFRKGETVVHGISATTDEAAQPGPDNMYLFSMSSHLRSVKMTTTKKLDEPFAYRIEVNTGEGRVEIADDAGNLVMLNSRDNQIRLENANGSFLDITDNILSMFASEKVKIDTDQYELNCKTATINCEEVIVKAGKSATLETTENTIQANTKHIGNIALVGNIGSTGGTTGDGEATFAGSIRTEKDFEAGGVAKVRKLISAEDIEAPNVD